MNTSKASVRVQDPLRDVTRKERRALLATSLIGLAMARGGIVPAEISMLGVSLSATDQAALLQLLALVNTYLLVAFAFYAAVDFVAWRIAFAEARIVAAQAVAKFEESLVYDPEHEEHRAVSEAYRGRAFWFGLSRPVSVVRVCIDIVLPVLVGAVAVALVLQRSTAA